MKAIWRYKAIGLQLCSGKSHFHKNATDMFECVFQVDDTHKRTMLMLENQVRQ